jgi:NDP-sugar pyrophosphorylase family protein
MTTIIILSSVFWKGHATAGSIRNAYKILVSTSEEFCVRNIDVDNTINIKMYIK